MICVNHYWNTALNKPPNKYYKFLRELFVTFTVNEEYVKFVCMCLHNYCCKQNNYIQN